MMDKDKYPHLVRVKESQAPKAKLTDGIRKPLGGDRDWCMNALLTMIRTVEGNNSLEFGYIYGQSKMSRLMLDMLSRIYDPTDAAGIYDAKHSPDTIANVEYQAK